MLLQDGAGQDPHQHPELVSASVPPVFGDEAGLAEIADHGNEMKEDLSVLLLSGGVCASCLGERLPHQPLAPKRIRSIPKGYFQGDFCTSGVSTRSCLSTGAGSGLRGDPGVESLGKKPVLGCQLWVRSWGPRDGTCSETSGEGCKRGKSSRRIIGI